MQRGRRHTMRSSCKIRIFGLPGGAKIETIGAIDKTGESHDANTAKTSGMTQESSWPERLVKKACKSANNVSVVSGAPIRAGKRNARRTLGAIGAAAYVVPEYSTRSAISKCSSFQSR